MVNIIRLNRLFGSLVLFFAFFFMLLGTMQAQDLNGRIFFIQARHSSMVFDVKDNCYAKWAIIQQWSSHGGTNQQFKFISTGDGSSYYIQNVKSGLFLDIYDSSLSNWANLIQYENNGGANQRFILQSASDGYYFFKCKHSGKYLDISKNSREPGAAVIQYSLNRGNNQQFKLIPVGQIASNQTKSYRLRYTLEYRRSSELDDKLNLGDLNTEDEIYFGVNISSLFDGNTANKNFFMRPIMGRDIYEMGDASNKSLSFSVFNGIIKPKEAVAVTLAVVEQDNAQIESIAQFGVAAAAVGGGIVAALLGEVAVASILINKAKDAATSGIEKLYKSFRDYKDELIGSVSMGIINKNGTVSLSVKGNQFAKVDRMSGNYAEITLNGGGAQYLLKIYLEDAFKPFIPTYIYLDKDEDACSCGKITVNGYAVMRGQTRDICVSSGGNAYAWYCCNSNQSANPPDWTNLIRTKYKNNKILWVWYHVEGEQPFLTRY